MMMIAKHPHQWGNTSEIYIYITELKNLQVQLRRLLVYSGCWQPRKFSNIPSNHGAASAVPEGLQFY